jgi:hypothetical protein
MLAQTRTLQALHVRRAPNISSVPGVLLKLIGHKKQLNFARHLKHCFGAVAAPDTIQPNDD